MKCCENIGPHFLQERRIRKKFKRDNDFGKFWQKFLPRKKHSKIFRQKKWDKNFYDTKNERNNFENFWFSKFEQKFFTREKKFQNL